MFPRWFPAVSQYIHLIFSPRTCYYLTKTSFLERGMKTKKHATIPHYRPYHFKITHCLCQRTLQLSIYLLYEKHLFTDSLSGFRPKNRIVSRLYGIL